MRWYPLLLQCLPVLAGWVIFPVHADVSLRIMDNHGSESTVYVHAGRCRLDSTAMPGYALIDTRDHSLVYADPARGEYSTLSETQLRDRLDQLDKVRESLAPHMETLRGGLEALPAEQRALFEQFLAGKAPPAAGVPVRLVSDGGMQHFAGLRCAHHHLLEGRHEVGDACLMQRPGGPLSAGDFNTLDTVMTLLRRYSGRAGGLLALAGNKSVLLQAQVDGIPLSLRDFETGDSYRVIASSPARIDDQLFSNYRRYRLVAAPALTDLF
jgi:hypothetical protein